MLYVVVLQATFECVDHCVKTQSEDHTIVSYDHRSSYRYPNSTEKDG